MKYRKFNSARTFARKLGLNGRREWYEYCKQNKIPKDIPISVNVSYKEKGWNSWGDFLGNSHVHPSKNEFIPFRKAREYAHGLRLKNQKEWSAFCTGRLERKNSINKGVPKTPQHVYAQKGWKGFGDWLGTGARHHGDIPHLPFEKARARARRLGVNTEQEWMRLKPLPSGQYRVPYKYFPEWVSWGDWLGTSFIATQLRRYKKYKQAEKFVHALNLMNKEQWRPYIDGELKFKKKLPDDIPRCPNAIYRGKGWKHWERFLGLPE